MKKLKTVLKWVFSTEYIITIAYSVVLWLATTRYSIPVAYTVSAITVLCGLYSISRGLGKKTCGGRNARFIEQGIYTVRFERRISGILLFKT